MVLVNILFFVVGLVLLVLGSEFFVKSAVSISKKLNISQFIIGLTLVALGTSIPELASAVVASIKNQSGLVMGNIIGANIANIGLITGVAAIIAMIKTSEEMLKRDGYIMLFVTLILYIFILNGVVSRVEAIILLLLYFAYILFLLEANHTKGKYHFREFLNYFFRFKYLITIRSRLVSGIKIGDKNVKLTQIQGIKELFREGLVKDFLIVGVSGLAIVLGARYFVDGAIFFAELLNLPTTIIGISIMSLGTTLPELSVTVSAARKGFGNIALGNVIGSNITNILLILGTAAFIHPLNVINFTLVYAAPFMIFMSILLLFFIRGSRKVKNIEGTIFLMLYTFFLASLFF